MSLKKYSFLKTSCPELFRLNSQEDVRTISAYSSLPQKLMQKHTTVSLVAFDEELWNQPAWSLGPGKYINVQIGMWASLLIGFWASQGNLEIMTRKLSQSLPGHLGSLPDLQSCWTAMAGKHSSNNVDLWWFMLILHVDVHCALGRRKLQWTYVQPTPVIPKDPCALSEAVTGGWPHATPG